MRIYRATIIAASIFTLYILDSFRPIFDDFYEIIWPTKFLLISFILLSVSLFIGYVFCNTFLGPWIMTRRSKRKFIENYIYLGNILQMENDLKDLAKQNDREAIQTFQVMNICKWSIVINLILIVVLALTSAAMQS